MLGFWQSDINGGYAKFINNGDISHWRLSFYTPEDKVEAIRVFLI
jgi:hypothetical protein